MKDEGAYVINSAEQKSIGTNWIPLHVNDDYLHNSWHGLIALTCVEYIPKRLKRLLVIKSKQIFKEYMPMAQLCVGTSVLDLLILGLKIKVW